MARLGLGQAHKGAHRAAGDGSCLEHPLSFRMLLLAAQRLSQEAQRGCVMAPEACTFLSDADCVHRRIVGLSSDMKAQRAEVMLSM